MLKHLINFYKVSSDKPCTDLSVSACQRRLKRLQWSTFLAAPRYKQVQSHLFWEYRFPLYFIVVIISK